MIGKRIVTWARRQFRPGRAGAAYGAGRFGLVDRRAGCDRATDLSLHARQQRQRHVPVSGILSQHAIATGLLHLRRKPCRAASRFRPALPSCPQPDRIVGTVFYTPYNGSMISLWDGTIGTNSSFPSCQTCWRIRQPAMPARRRPSRRSCYDLFLWNSGTKAVPVLTLTRGPAWTTCLAPGARAAGGALAGQNGVPVNAVAITNGPAIGRGVLSERSPPMRAARPSLTTLAARSRRPWLIFSATTTGCPASSSLPIPASSTTTRWR
jgi:hypothetical protein